jgi:manganese-dependent inorganic pyrophosphatase
MEGPPLSVDPATRLAADPAPPRVAPLHPAGAGGGVQTIVIGHRNPDMDSICAAVGYARLKQLLGVPNVIAARAGNTNPRIDFVLEKFGVPAPVFLSDVSPRVSDVMERQAASVRADASVYDALHLIEEKQLRGLPVTDDRHRCLGLLSAFKISHHLFPPREEAARARVIVASLASIVETFGGRVVAGELTTESAELLLVVGAMNADSFSHRLRGHGGAAVVLFVGDRDDIQMRAIEAQVRAIVVTGGLPVLRSVESAAREAGVAMVSSPHDTATTVLLARGADGRDRIHQLCAGHAAGERPRAGRGLDFAGVSDPGRGRRARGAPDQERFSQGGAPPVGAGGP